MKKLLYLLVLLVSLLDMHTSQAATFINKCKPGQQPKAYFDVRDVVDSWQDLSKSYIRNYGTSPAVFAVNVPANYTTVGTTNVNGVKGQPAFFIAINPGNSDTQMSVSASINPCEGAFNNAISFGDWTPTHSIYTTDDPRGAQDTSAHKLVLVPGQVNYIMVWPTPNYNRISNPNYEWNFGAGFKNSPNFGGNGTLQASQNSNPTYATFPTGSSAPSTAASQGESKYSSVFGYTCAAAHGRGGSYKLYDGLYWQGQGTWSSRLPLSNKESKRIDFTKVTASNGSYKILTNPNPAQGLTEQEAKDLSAKIDGGVVVKDPNCTEVVTIPSTSSPWSPIGATDVFCPDTLAIANASYPQASSYGWQNSGNTYFNGPTLPVSCVVGTQYLQRSGSGATCSVYTCKSATNAAVNAAANSNQASSGGTFASLMAFFSNALNAVGLTTLSSLISTSPAPASSLDPYATLSSLLTSTISTASTPIPKPKPTSSSSNTPLANLVAIPKPKPTEAPTPKPKPNGSDVPSSMLSYLSIPTSPTSINTINSFEVRRSTTGYNDLGVEIPKTLSIEDIINPSILDIVKAWSGLAIVSDSPRSMPPGVVISNPPRSMPPAVVIQQPQRPFTNYCKPGEQPKASFDIREIAVSWQELRRSYIRNYGTSPAVFAVNVPADYTTVGTREISSVKGQPLFYIAIAPGNSETTMSVSASTNPCEGAFNNAISFGDWTPTHNIYTTDDPRGAADYRNYKLILVPGQVNYIMVWPTPNNLNRFGNPEYEWNFGAGFGNEPNGGGNGTIMPRPLANSTDKTPYATFPTGSSPILSPAIGATNKNWRAEKTFYCPETASEYPKADAFGWKILGERYANGTILPASCSANQEYVFYVGGTGTAFKAGGGANCSLYSCVK